MNSFRSQYHNGKLELWFVIRKQIFKENVKNENKNEERLRLELKRALKLWKGIKKFWLRQWILLFRSLFIGTNLIDWFLLLLPRKWDLFETLNDNEILLLSKLSFEFVLGIISMEISKQINTPMEIKKYCHLNKNLSLRQIVLCNQWLVVKRFKGKLTDWDKVNWHFKWACQNV